MQISEQTIHNFFDGLCSKEEAEKVADFLQANPEILDNYFNEEWTDLPTERLGEPEAASLWSNVLYAISFRERKSLKWIRPAIAIAASLLLMVIAKKMFFDTTQINNTVAKVEDAGWKECWNMSDTLMATLLEDGTNVTVYPKSFVRWKSFANQPTRDIFMDGHAMFSVAKNKAKPFTVHASGASTTALGTVFDVVASKGKICVKLFEGRVVIKAARVMKGWKRDSVYLNPGDSFTYDSLRQVFEVKPIIDNLNASQPKEKRPAIAKAGKSNNWFMFNNQPLSNVLQHLESIYNVEIECRGIDLQKVYFIGKFDKSDSVESILQTIALLKGYQLHHEGNKYILMPA